MRKGSDQISNKIVSLVIFTLNTLEACTLELFALFEGSTRILAQQNIIQLHTIIGTMKACQGKETKWVIPKARKRKRRQKEGRKKMKH